MFKKTFTFGVLLVIVVAAVLVTPDIGQAQRYFGGYSMYHSYYQPYYGNYGPYYGYPHYYGPYSGYQNYYRPYYDGYYDYGLSGYYRTYPRYGYYTNNYR